MDCPCRTPDPDTGNAYGRAYARMLELMPGWFAMLDDLMDEYGPFPRVRRVAAIADAHPERDLDDIIHEEMREEWFQYHDDYDEDW